MSKTTFIELIFLLNKYWESCGCVIIQPLDIEIGAATSHPMTFFHVISSNPISFAYVQNVRRPNDGRYASNPIRMQQYYQFQVIVKPSPKNIQELYLNSLEAIGIDCASNDIKFVEDNWENPTLGAWGLGWEVWLNGMEITQFTYFQHMGGLPCHLITSEITYGLERLAFFLQDVDSVYDIVWSKTVSGLVTYRDLFFLNEVEKSMYNFEFSNVDFLFTLFDKYIEEANRLILLKQVLFISAYECILKAIHFFNLLDARKVISVTERQNYIVRICNITKKIALSYKLNPNL